MLHQALVLQHVPFEPAGTLIDHLLAAGYVVDVRHLHRGDRIPLLDRYKLLIIMGGPMSVHDTERHPWLVDESAAIAAAVGRDLATLGICLGAQLIAQAAGARVFKGPIREIGWGPIELTPAVRADPLWGPVENPVEVFHWHGETFDLPAGAVHLARSDLYPHQAFRIGRHVYGLQFHVEVTAGMVHGMIENNPGDLEGIDPAELTAGSRDKINGLYDLSEGLVRRILATIP